MTFSTLGLAVEDSSVVTATPHLKSLTAAAVQAETAASQLGRASSSSSGGLGAMSRAAAQAEASVKRVSASITGARYQTAGLAAQFQDVGVTAAMGMSPLLIGLQQGTQLAGQLATMANPIKGLGSAIASLLSPVSLLSVGFTALLAVGIQWAASMFQASSNAKQALADQAMSVDQVKSGIGQLQNITDDYARAIRGTAKDQEIATGSILANSEKEFNAKKSLLDLELKRQQALIATQQIELSAVQKQLRQDIAVAIPNVDDPRESPFAPSASRINRREALGEFLAKTPLTDRIQELRANIDLTEVATSKLEEALNTTFAGSVAISAGNIASTAETAAQKMQGKYDDLVRSANQHIAASRLEATTLGMTTEQINAQVYAMEMLNRAANDDIKLKPKQIDQLVDLARQMAAAEEQTRQLTEAYEFGKSTFSSFFSDLKSNLREGQSLWESMGNAAANALDKIADRALGMAADGIFDLLFGAVMGGITGGVGGGTWGQFGGFAGKPGMFGLPGMAAGGTVAQGGLSWVGENGPELLRLPRGAQVIPNGASMAMAANGNGPSISIGNISISANSEKEGAAAARGFVAELNKHFPAAMERYQRNPLRRAS